MTAADLDPAALAFALATLRAQGDDEAAAELLHLLGDTSASDDTEDAATREALEEARAVRKDGDTWSVGNNHYKKVAGKIRKVADPGKAAARQQAQQQQTDSRAKGRAAAAKLAAGALTHDDVRDLDDHFATLPRDEMREVARKLGAKIGGLKAELAQRLVDRARQLAAGTATPPAAPEPAPEPAAPADGPHAVQHHVIGALNAAEGLSDAQREHYGAAAARVLRTMPRPALDALGDGLDGITFHPKLSAIAQGMIDQMANQPGLDDAQRAALRKQYEYLKNERIGGVYMRGFKHVHVDGAGSVAHVKGRHVAGFADTHGIYAHELTHALDGPDQTLSKSPEWAAAKAAEIDFAAGAEPPLTTYAATKPSESFAEFGRLVYGSDVPHAQIAAEFPKATAFFKSKGLWPAAERAGPAAKLPEVFERAVELPNGHADVLKAPTARAGESLAFSEADGPDADPEAVAYALAVLRAGGEDEAAAELLHELYGADPLAESAALLEHAQTPPHPGLVFDETSHRWVNPHTGEDHPDEPDHPHAEHAAATADHDAQPAAEKGRFAQARAAVADRLSATKGGRAILAMGRGGAWLFHKLEHKFLFAAKKTQELAVAAAKERGLAPDRAEKLKRALYLADFAGGYATGAAALAVAGPIAGKVAAIMPSASVAYLAYSTSRNPLATWRAAKAVVKATFQKGGPAAHESVTPELAARLADRLQAAADPDWFLALFHAALAHAEGDPERALDAADRALAEQPAGPGDAVGG